MTVATVAAWKITCSIRVPSQSLALDALEDLAFLEATVAPSSQPERQIITLIVNAPSAEMALDYGSEKMRRYWPAPVVALKAEPAAERACP